MIETVLESPDPIKAFGIIVHVNNDSLELHDDGACKSATYEYYLYHFDLSTRKLKMLGKYLATSCEYYVLNPAVRVEETS